MRVGFVNGCFDLLHVGHIEMLEYAKSMCDHLVVAVDTDQRVRQSKGPTRPFNNVDDRQRMLIALRAVDETACFSTGCICLDPSINVMVGPVTCCELHLSVAR